MDSMFRGATSFNGDVSNWNVTAVTLMDSMFRGATSFNGDVSNWNVEAVTNMRYMFPSRHELQRRRLELERRSR